MVKILEIGDSTIPIYVSSYVAVAFASFVIGNGIYLVLTIPSLLFPIRNCRFILFPLSPVDSPFIAKSVSAFSKLIFGYALGFSLVLIELIYLNPFSSEATMQIALGTLIFGLFLISYSFLLPNYFLSQIIKNEKTRILKDLQGRIMELYVDPQLLDAKKTNDIKAITDVYEKVKASREYPIKFSGFRSYITSLLLPILSFFSGFVNWEIDISNWLAQ